MKRREADTAIHVTSMEQLDIVARKRKHNSTPINANDDTEMDVSGDDDGSDSSVKEDTV